MSARIRGTIASTLAVVVAACAVNRPEHTASRLVIAETLPVLQAIHEELNRDLIPVDFTTSRYVVRSLPFDPAVLWSEQELPARVECRDRHGNWVAPVGRVTLQVTAAAEERGRAQPEDATHWTPAVLAARHRTQIVLRSQGNAQQGVADASCALSESYTKELVRRIASRFPEVKPPPRVSTGE